jgi:hypothetical protein
MVMRTVLGTLVLLLALAGCGSDEGHTDGGLKPDPSASEAAQVTQVALVTGTSAGGEVTTALTVLADEAAVRTYADQFRNDGFQGEIVAAARKADVPEGQQLAAAVVAIGCEVPTKVFGTEDDLRVVLPSPTKECFAPITTVALVLVPQGGAQ